VIFLIVIGSLIFEVSLIVIRSRIVIVSLIVVIVLITLIVVIFLIVIATASSCCLIAGFADLLLLVVALCSF
jgi:hypothetical protein